MEKFLKSNSGTTLSTIPTFISFRDKEVKECIVEFILEANMLFDLGEGFAKWFNNVYLFSEHGLDTNKIKLITPTSSKCYLTLALNRTDFAKDIIKKQKEDWCILSSTYKKDSSYNKPILTASSSTVAITTNNLTNSISLDLSEQDKKINQLEQTFQQLNIALRDCNGSFRSTESILRDLSDALTDYKENTTNNKDKENNFMKFNFDFGPCTNDNVRMSIYGMAIKNPSGTWVAYDKASGNIMDVDVLNFDGRNMMYKIPVAIKDIRAGDCIIHNRLPMIVSAITGATICVIDVMNGESKNILPTKSPFGFDFYTKVISLLDNCGFAATPDNPFGNMLPLMLFSQDNEGMDKKSLMMMLMMMNGGMDMNNPMMYLMLMNQDGDFDSDSMMPVLMMGMFNQNRTPATVSAPIQNYNVNNIPTPPSAVNRTVYDPGQCHD